MKSSSIRLLHGSHILQSYTRLLPIDEFHLFILVDEGNHEQFGRIYYGIRIGCVGACPWAFPASHVREVTAAERDGVVACIVTNLLPLPKFLIGDKLVWNTGTVQPSQLVEYSGRYGPGPFKVEDVTRLGEDQFLLTLRHPNGKIEQMSENYFLKA